MPTYWSGSTPVSSSRSGNVVPAGYPGTSLSVATPGGSGGGYYSPETQAAGNKPPLIQDIVPSYIASGTKANTSGTLVEEVTREYAPMPDTAKMAASPGVLNNPEAFHDPTSDYGGYLGGNAEVQVGGGEDESSIGSVLAGLGAVPLIIIGVIAVVILYMFKR